MRLCHLMIIHNGLLNRLKPGRFRYGSFELAFENTDIITSECAGWKFESVDAAGAAWQSALSVGHHFPHHIDIDSTLLISTYSDKYCLPKHRI